LNQNNLSKYVENHNCLKLHKNLKKNETLKQSNSKQGRGTQNKRRGFNGSF